MKSLVLPPGQAERSAAVRHDQRATSETEAIRRRIAPGQQAARPKTAGRRLMATGLLLLACGCQASGPPRGGQAALAPASMTPVEHRMACEELRAEIAQRQMQAIIVVSGGASPATPRQLATRLTLLQNHAAALGCPPPPADPVDQEPAAARQPAGPAP